MASPPLIEFRQISKIYGEGEAAIRALDHVDLAINAHEFVAIMGPSGSGKSTAMNILGCLDVPSAGDYIFEGIPTSGFDRSQLTLLRRHMLGFVFQGFNLLSRTSAVENVELPLIYRGMAVRERRERAREALALVGLTGREHHKTQELSGGQQQRVAIARAIVTEPALLLADEPTGNLDTKTSVEIMDLMTRLNREQGITIVMVTHEPDIAAYAQRLLRFVDGKLETEVEHRRRADHVL
ncbi:MULTISPECIES: ABC transporter ATP-binding protein [Rhizobium]|uniref:ABC transporter related n=1 Tax=Rhizobium leguminosarum bv. trifolii (strain WSM1325) TaxID=395491 RepID=C6AXN4_RHILS|nr:MULTISPECIES: ABC transporter ATP-binding protein [Rhizobium]NKJ75277.1 ATP-binding cassette domain-containing protein [Rhizobium leguminosarum bv. viciae]ACS56175.1 ABC transporter related [Rhizobium leguminosarum bv. trifolii WSM1325]MBY2907936.1 ABC transporter ATP-binding protein [Rhizobium leguminosarum]MBY2924928.1 ABC transporter ATP-binding protein [Rhizobium leguminosarum]MBY2936568.1 ABC transporter ATP-binding protein [Rhizobium leguminosarum]